MNSPCLSRRLPPFLRRALAGATPLGVLAACLMAGPAGAQIGVSITIAPPPLLVYAQPPAPAEGYLWTPGYWSWRQEDNDYFWVPGTWVMAPQAGYLWTPGYWAFENAVYLWHIGYWGDHVGFYGGLNYGYGYSGNGYQGGRWERGAFRYNRAVSNVNVQVIHNVYNVPVTYRHPGSHASFNGGPSGVTARPTDHQRQELAATHTGPSADQIAHEHAAQAAPSQRAGGTHGTRPVAATPKPGALEQPGAEPVRTAPTSPQRGKHPVSAPPVQAAPQPVDKTPHPATQPQRQEQKSPSPAPRESAQPERAQPQRPERQEKAAPQGRQDKPGQDDPRKER